MNSIVRSHKDLIVWQKSMDLVELVYALTKSFSDEERYNLVSQMRRSAVSIPCNIAEGRRRGSRKDYARFVQIAYGSSAELETQAEIALRLNYLTREDYKIFHSNLVEIMKMLNVMQTKLKLPANS